MKSRFVFPFVIVCGLMATLPARARELHDEPRGATTVHVYLHDEGPLIQRTFLILKERIEERAPVRVDRTGEETVADLVFSVSEDLPRDAFSIDREGGKIRIAGGSPSGILYGVGKFLRTSRYDRGFRPSSWVGESRPRGDMRGIYFASHFHNWYHVAPEPEIRRYVEDLALWGCNAARICFPFINLQDWNDPAAEEAVAMARLYGRICEELDLAFGVGASNALFKGVPDSLRATRLPDPTRRRGNSGNPVCPSNPEGRAFILAQIREMIDRLDGVSLDFIMTWPYDEGGCACDRCSPWGCNGYLKLTKDVTELVRKTYPEAKTVLSTWMFDTPPSGEWEGLSKVLRSDPGWVDYILADSHEEFPRYPLEVEVPGNLPLLNFPEISMWGNWPWGGVGANPLPNRLQRLWEDIRSVVRGGFPYSEGIYEDMNKVVVFQYYWDPNRNAKQTLAEYVSYEYSPEVVDEVLALIDLLESSASQSYRKKTVDVEKVRKAYRIAQEVDKRLPEWARKGWRWEILYLRAVLDRERFDGGGLETPAAEKALRRLMEIYHSQYETDDPYHHRVRPPLRGAISRNGEL